VPARFLNWATAPLGVNLPLSLDLPLPPRYCARVSK
jgi:hypothetical protein